MEPSSALTAINVEEAHAATAELTPNPASTADLLPDSINLSYSRNCSNRACHHPDAQKRLNKPELARAKMAGVCSSGPVGI